MAVVEVNLCDLCLGEGYHVIAVARYWNDEGEEWHACKKHLVLVKELGLGYECFSTDE